jgi:hypothetical protein
MPPVVLLPPLVFAVGLVAGAYVLARHVGFVVPFAFIATYVLGVGALTLFSIGALDMVDPKFREKWVMAWLEIYWPLWTVFFAPSAICALFATWFSRATERRDAATMLGSFLALILMAIEIEWALDRYIGQYGFWTFVVAFAILSAIFLAIARVARMRRTNERLPRLPKLPS